jgi:hypothetical protein
MIYTYKNNSANYSKYVLLIVLIYLLTGAIKS